MALNYVTLTVDVYDGQGNVPASGTATFTPSAVLTDAGVEIIGQQPVTAVFHAAALPTVKLLATDNSDPAPAGWTWSVSFSGITGAPAAFSFFLPYTGGSSQVLSSLAPVASGTAFQTYLAAGTPGWLILAIPALTFTSITRNGNEAITSASVKWPDGTTGTWTTDTLSSSFPGAVDAYHVTYGSVHTVTQAAVTRDASGAVTAQPALAVT